MRKLLVLRGSIEMLEHAAVYLDRLPGWDAGDGEHYGRFKDVDDAFYIIRNRKFELQADLVKLKK